MAYGYFCPSCAGTVDGNEFNHGKGICRECAEKQEKNLIKFNNLPVCMDGQYQYRRQKETE